MQMTYLAFLLLLGIIILGIVFVFQHYSNNESKMAFLSAIATTIIVFGFSYLFIKIGVLPDFIGVEKFETEVLSGKKQTEMTETITETFSAKQVYRDGDNAIIEDEGGYKIIVDLYGWHTEVYYNGKKEEGVKVKGLYWYTSNLNNIKDKNKFVKTKIFKSKDGSLKKIEIILEDNRHKKDFEVSY